MATRWGIASAARISHDFTNALATLPKGEHEVVAVGASDLSRAQKFANLHGINKSYGSYEELARDPDVDVVHIGVRNADHLNVAKLMLENGKHVLCEKPMTLNVKQSTELINLAKQKGLFLMEGIWSRCFPLYQRVRKEIDSGTIGDVKQIIVTLGANLTDVERLNVKSQGGGTILDLGVYLIQLVQMVYDGEHPLSIKASGFLNNDGVDQSMSATLLYSNNRTATIVGHGRVELPRVALIVGTKGTIKIPQFYCPVKVELPMETVEDPLPQAPLQFNFINSAGLRFEAMEVRECLKAGLKESPKVSHAESLRIAEIEQELRKQIGVVYPQD